MLVKPYRSISLALFSRRRVMNLLPQRGGACQECENQYGSLHVNLVYRKNEGEGTPLTTGSRLLFYFQ